MWNQPGSVAQEITSADESSLLVNLLGSVVLFVPVADTNKELMLPHPKQGLAPFARKTANSFSLFHAGGGMVLCQRAAVSV